MKSVQNRNQVKDSTVLHLIEPRAVRGYRRCFVAIIPVRSRNVYVAYAQCSPSDQFDAGFGMKLASNRARGMIRSKESANGHGVTLRIPKDKLDDRKEAVQWLQQALSKKGLFRTETTFTESEGFKIERTYREAIRLMGRLSLSIEEHLDYVGGMETKHLSMLNQMNNAVRAILRMQL